MKNSPVGRKTPNKQTNKSIFKSKQSSFQRSGTVYDVVKHWDGICRVCLKPYSFPFRAPF